MSALVPWGRLELGHGASAALGDEPGSVIHHHGAYAVFSEDGQYRYRLLRDIRGEPPRANAHVAGAAWHTVPREELLDRLLLWILLNPSTAGALASDPTLRKCVSYGRAWGYGRIELVNMYGYRATDPIELIGRRKAHHDVRGPMNAAAVVAAARDADLIVGGWGTKAAHDDVLALEDLIAARVHKPIHAIALTQAGWPRHPLYEPLARVARPWRARAVHPST